MDNLSFSDLEGRVCVITGGAGVLGAAMIRGLAAAKLKIAILDLDGEKARELSESLHQEFGISCVGITANVLDKSSLEEARNQIHQTLGKIDILINAAGGNSPKATTVVEQIMPEDKDHLEGTFYGLETEAFDRVFALNFKGTLLPTLVMTLDMMEAGKGAVLNISSMNAFRPLTRIPAYSAAKSSINNFTQWLSVHLARTGIRVNAIAPGFFLTRQNRFLLTDEKTGAPTPRGSKILSNTPMGRYGDPAELNGTVLFLLSDLSGFITGVVIPVDGGYSAFGGI